MFGKRHNRLRWFFLLATCLAVGGSTVMFVYRRGHAAPQATSFRTSNDPQVLLAEANRLYMLFNTHDAEPLYARAEQLFHARGDLRNELYAKIGRIRSQAETLSFVDISNFLELELQIPLVQGDPRLKLWCLAAKGMTDNEINAPGAK